MEVERNPNYEHTIIHLIWGILGEKWINVDVRGLGFEPRYSDSESEVLPLDDPRWRAGFIVTQSYIFSPSRT